jgi:hypothetical protein
MKSARLCLLILGLVPLLYGRTAHAACSTESYTLQFPKENVAEGLPDGKYVVAAQLTRKGLLEVTASVRAGRFEEYDAAIQGKRSLDVPLEKLPQSARACIRVPPGSRVEGASAGGSLFASLFEWIIPTADARYYRFFGVRGNSCQSLAGTIVMKRINVPDAPDMTVLEWSVNGNVCGYSVMSN